MSTKRTMSERIGSQRDRILQMQNELKELERRNRAANRKARTTRICRRGGFLESVLPDTILLSDERFDTFIEKHVASKYGREMLEKLKAEQEKEEAAGNTALPTPPQTINQSPVKPATSPALDNKDVSDDEDNDDAGVID